MSRAGHAFKVRSRHCGKTGQLAAFSPKQASRRGSDSGTIETPTQLCADSAAGAQAHAHRAIEPLSETIEVFFRGTETQFRQKAGLPITPEFFLIAVNAERAAWRKALHIAEDGAFDGHVD